MKALVGAFNQEKALVGAFFVIVQPVVEPMEHYTALSRADLWTFASAVAVEWGLDRNNNACDGSDTAGDGVSTSHGFPKS